MNQLRVNVFMDRNNLNKTLQLDDNSIVSDLLKKLKINPVTVIVSRDNELILDNEKLRDGDEIKILSVISGG